MVEIDVVSVEDMLERFGLLPRWAEHSRDELAQAVEQQLALLALMDD
jgi:hypothetical protein